MTAPCPTCGHLNAAGTKFCPECGTKLGEPAAPAREMRKTVTILFADVTGSTALGEQLDPETLRAIMGRYFAMMKAVIERHGGTVEKFIGDAVMAVFGIPTVHEDDALRAVRAAADIRTELGRLNAELEASRGIAIRFRTGVNTGEVVAGDPAAGQTLVTGDTVNTAARLEQAASPGEILLGRLTWNLVRDAVEAEPVEPIAAKGKALPLTAWRLVAVRSGEAGHSRRLDAPLVGRERELVLLQGAFERTLAERSCQLFTLLGTAGVGKSRLVAEFLGSVSSQTAILKGRCLPYGEGITYWPLRDIVLAAAGIDESDDAAASLAKLGALVADERDGPLIASSLAAAIGLSSEAIPQEEIFWAARKLLEGLARERPLVVLVEDIHWAEPTLLDLLEHVADLARDAPLLLLCPARPELLDRRTGWGGGKLNATTILLEPLGAEAAEELIAGLPGGSALPAELRTRIIAAAEGNPLYVEEMLGMLIDEGRLVDADGVWQTDGDLAEVTVPPSISALLAARLDALAPLERAIAERAAVVGRVFEQAAVAELASDALRPEVAHGLVSLVRKELIRPDRSDLAAGDAFKFRHLLIRDAAYEALPKAERAELHERFADWLARAAGDRLVEYQEVLGHHLEQAHACRVELGQTGARVEQLAERAASALVLAANRALVHDDFPASSAFLERALGLTALTAQQRIAALETLATALLRLGRYREGVDAATQMRTEAIAVGDRAGAQRATVLDYDIRSTFDPSVYRDTNELSSAITELELLGDQRGLALAWIATVSAHGGALHWEEARRASEHAIVAADGAIDVSIRRIAVSNFAFCLLWGTTPVSEARTRVDAVLAENDSRLVRCYVLPTLADLCTLAGVATDSDKYFAEALAVLRELGLSNRNALWSRGAALAAIGKFDEAETDAQEALAMSQQVGNSLMAPSAAAIVALCRLRLDRDADVGPLLDIARQAHESDIGGQAQWRCASALDALSRGGGGEAERLAREAVALLEETDAPIEQSEADIVLAEVLAADGRSDEATSLLLRARDRYVAKEASACAARVDKLLEGIREP